MNDGWPPEDIAGRERIALEAVWEIDMLAHTVARIEGSEGEELVRRGLVIRIRQLTSVAMSHLSGETDARRETAEMHEVVYGQRPAEAEAEAEGLGGSK